MRRPLTMFLLISGHVLAQDQDAFEPPHAHDIRRYEAGWNKNPFSLKTTPVAAKHAGFAKDWAIGAYFGSLEDPTIVLVNTKTHERLRLKKGQRASTGITLDAVSLGGRRSEAFVELRALGGETAQVRFDEAYLRQVAANAAKNTPASPASPQQTPVSAAAAKTVRVSAAASPTQQTAAIASQTVLAPIPEALRGILPPSAFAAAPTTESPAEAPASASSTPPPTTGNVSAGQNTPLPVMQRRRSITVVQY